MTREVNSCNRHSPTATDRCDAMRHRSSRPKRDLMRAVLAGHRNLGTRDFVWQCLVRKLFVKAMKAGSMYNCLIPHIQLIYQRFFMCFVWVVGPFVCNLFFAHPQATLTCHKAVLAEPPPPKGVRASVSPRRDFSWISMDLGSMDGAIIFCDVQRGC